MKLTDIDKVNRLVADLAESRSLIDMAEKAPPDTFQLFIEAPGDASLKMSAEGAATTHSRGTGVTPAFLARLKKLAVEELHARRAVVLKELTALGVDTAEG